MQPNWYPIGFEFTIYAVYIYVPYNVPTKKQMCIWKLT